MSKSTNYKKVLVRNTVKPLPKTVSSTDTKSSDLQSKKLMELKSPEETAFEFPELYSALKLSKKLDEIQNFKKKKSPFENTEKLAFDEKVTRKVNFPYDQPIYKDLIQLSTPTTSQTTIQKRAPLPQKDKEPNLEDFAGVYEAPEYCYIPETSFNSKPPRDFCNNLRLYQILQIHNE